MNIKQVCKMGTDAQTFSFASSIESAFSMSYDLTYCTMYHIQISNLFDILLQNTECYVLIVVMIFGMIFFTNKARPPVIYCRNIEINDYR
jgi:F0F1-type ATP synthase assembly protein I